MPCDEATSEGLVGSKVFVYLMLASVYYGVEILNAIVFDLCACPMMKFSEGLCWFGSLV